MNKIALMLIDMASFYSYEMEKRQLEMYVDVLSKFPEQAVLDAGRAYVLNPKNSKFPIPPHSIMVHFFPETDPRSLAIATVGRIKEAINLFGWPKPNDARTYIGDQGWRYIERCGGWQSVCEKPELNINEPNVHAQMRDAIEADIKLDRSGFDMDKPLIEQSKQKPGLENASEIITRLLPKNEK